MYEYKRATTLDELIEEAEKLDPMSILLEDDIINLLLASIKAIKPELSPETTLKIDTIVEQSKRAYYRHLG